MNSSVDRRNPSLDGFGMFDVVTSGGRKAASTLPGGGEEPPSVSQPPSGGAADALLGLGSGFVSTAVVASASAISGLREARRKTAAAKAANCLILFLGAVDRYFFPSHRLSGCIFHPPERACLMPPSWENTIR